MDILLIQDGVVIGEITADSAEQAGEFYPDYLCLQNPSAFQVGDLYDGVNFTKIERVNLKEIRDVIVAAMLDLMDEKARERGFVTMIEALTFVDSSIAPLQQQAVILQNWREACFSYALIEFDKLSNKLRQPPGSIAAFLGELPDI